MTCEKAIEIIQALWCYEEVEYPEEDIREALYIAKKTLEIFEQIKWERDVAVAQLKELGYKLDQKKKTCDGCFFKFNRDFEERCRQCNRYINLDKSDRYYSLSIKADDYDHERNGYNYRY